MQNVKESTTGETQTVFNVGDTDKDGWIYAGVSDDTNKDMWLEPQDAGVMKWYEAHDYAKSIGKTNNAEFRLPSLGELRQIFKLWAEIPGLRKTTRGLSSAYWSSTKSKVNADCMKLKFFDDGGEFGAARANKASVRCVRS